MLVMGEEEMDVHGEDVGDPDTVLDADVEREGDTVALPLCVGDLEM